MQCAAPYSLTQCRCELARTEAKTVNPISPPLSARGGFLLVLRDSTGKAELLPVHNRGFTCDYALYNLKMFIPCVDTRVEKTNISFRYVVKSTNISTFGIIAVSTRPSEIVDSIGTTMLDRTNMVNLVWLITKLLR